MTTDKTTPVPSSKDTKTDTNTDAMKSVGTSKETGLLMDPGGGDTGS